MEQGIKEFLQKAKKDGKIRDNDVAIEIHHTLMKEYGWIPKKEFEELPIPMMFNLLDRINRDRENERKSWKGDKGKGKRLNKRG